MTQLVVMTEATAERLGRDARLGRLLRFVVVPLAVGVGAMFVLDAVLGDTPAILIALGATAIFLTWESVGPGGRRRRALMGELEAAIEQLQSGARTAAPSPEVDGPGKEGHS